MATPAGSRRRGDGLRGRLDPLRCTRGGLLVRDDPSAVGGLRSAWTRCVKGTRSRTAKKTIERSQKSSA
jgi:hypothetical protein